MKPLILILLASIYAGAQTIADVARQERARQAGLQPAKVLSNIGVNGATPGAASKAAPAGDPEKTPAAQAPQSPSEAPRSAVSDPAPSPGASGLSAGAAEFEDKVRKTRLLLRGLMDQETALQLQINTFTNEFFSPVTTTTAQRQAQTKLNDAKNRLDEVQRALIQTRTTLQELEARGPLKK